MRQSLKQHAKTCQWCKQAFIAQRSDARFCTSSCRSYAYRRGGEVSSSVEDVSVAAASEEAVAANHHAAIIHKVVLEPQKRHGSYPKPGRIEETIRRRQILQDNPWQYGPPGEYVNSPYSILSFDDEVARQLYVTVYRREFEDDSPLHVKDKKLFLPTADLHHLLGGAIQRYYFQSKLFVY
ncbi:hypothetical protein [Flavisolibacter nicotianae]|uniref:hypothetical protein n=1 Tax=Flavisolibacter nicotianae TaxID=2364882 RepID=UPI000EB23B05|nr:hypothetical protein [Flavisolibacter nicotianae]